MSFTIKEKCYCKFIFEQLYDAVETIVAVLFLSCFLCLLQTISLLIFRSSVFDHSDMSAAMTFSMFCCVTYCFEILDTLVDYYTTWWSGKEQLTVQLVDKVFMCLSKRLHWMTDNFNVHKVSLWTKSDYSNFVTDVSSKLKMLLSNSMNILFGTEFSVKNTKEIEVRLIY